VFKNTAEDRAPLVNPIHIVYRSSKARFLVDLFVSSFLLLTVKEMIRKENDQKRKCVNI